MSQNISLGSLPILDVNGLQLAWVTTTTLTMAAGQARDSNNVIDILLTAPVTIDGTINGANGLDTGSLANSTWYYIYLIGSSLNYQQPAALISASATPLMPAGYDSYRRIGFTLTDGSAHFLKFSVYGSDSTREYFWDVAIQEVAGVGSTSYVAVNMQSSVPPTANIVRMNWIFVANSAGNTAAFRVTGSTNSSGTIIIGSPAAAQMAGILNMNCNNSQSIDFKTASASDVLQLFTTGFEDFI